MIHNGKKKNTHNFRRSLLTVLQRRENLSCSSAWVVLTTLLVKYMSWRLLARFPLSGGFGTWVLFDRQIFLWELNHASPPNINGTDTRAYLAAGSSEDVERRLVLKGIMSTLQAFRLRCISTEAKSRASGAYLPVLTLTEQATTGQAPVLGTGRSGYFGESTALKICLCHWACTSAS